MSVLARGQAQVRTLDCEPSPEFAADPQSCVSPLFASLANKQSVSPVFTNRSVSDSNQNHFIPFAELIRV